MMGSLSVSAKFFLWKDHHIKTYNEREVNDVVLFGFLAAEFFSYLTNAMNKRDPDDVCENGTVSSTYDLPILAQFHDGMAGSAILEIKKKMLPIATVFTTTVFTTHATLLVRYLAVHDSNFYHYLRKVDPYGAAEDWGILPRFSIERAAAWAATVFTTVSDITGFEAEHFLGRRPDLLVPNGLNIQRFAAIHEFQNLHVHYKKRIHEFVMVVNDNYNSLPATITIPWLGDTERLTKSRLAPRYKHAGHLDS